MADETGEPVTASETPDENGPYKNEKNGDAIIEDSLAEQNLENNTEDNHREKIMFEIDEAEPTDTNIDEQKDAEPIGETNKENIDIEEHDENKAYVESTENLKINEQVGSKEHVKSVENFETKENVPIITDTENLENEELSRNQEDDVNLKEDAEKDHVEDEIAEEQTIESKDIEKDQNGEEHVSEEQAKSEEKKGEEIINDEIEEETENEDGTKSIKKVERKKISSGELIQLQQVTEEEETFKEEFKEPEELPETQKTDFYEDEHIEMPEELPPDPAAPLGYSDSKEAIKPPFRLRPDQIAELESLWELFQDYTPVYTDIDGYITEKELVYMLKSLLLMTYTPEQMQELITFVCRPPHPKGHITYDQFLKMVTLRQRDLSIEDELRQSMKVMDFDNTGTVERDFFKETLTTKGHRMPTKMVDFLIKEVDITNDGTLGVEDVVGTMCMDLNPEDLEMLRKAVYPEENKSIEEEQEEVEAPVEDKSDDDDDDDD